MIFKNLVFLALVTTFLSGCVETSTYRAYLGAPREALRVATLTGAQFDRRDAINRYTDAVKFSGVDGTRIEDSIGYRSLELAPGFHDVRVYFYWDMGSLRGLAPALVSYAASGNELSRTLRFNARAGMSYSVKAQPHFNDQKEDITTLSHVDFWVEDQNGVEIVSKESGRYRVSTAAP